MQVQSKPFEPSKQLAQGSGIFIRKAELRSTSVQKRSQLCTSNSIGHINWEIKMKYTAKIYKITINVGYKSLGPIKYVSE